jgi:glycosyltransferase involved in cell wall biosynthesis
MRIGLLSYPMLFQREGRLQALVRQTLLALNRLERVRGIPLMQAELVDPCHARLDDYDLVHVFSAAEGNHRIVETAREMGVPVVLSPMLSPMLAPAWGRLASVRARLAERALGAMGGAAQHTSYAQIRSALRAADMLLALNEDEHHMLGAAFQIAPAKVRLVPRGIDAHFFEAGPALFCSRISIDGAFGLMPVRRGSSEHQLGVARVLAEMALPLVLIGEDGAHETPYLRELRALPGVIWLGSLRHEERMLASAFAAAAVFLETGARQNENVALNAFDALASGTPVLMTTDSAPWLPDSGFALVSVERRDTGAFKRAMARLLDAPPERERVRALVHGYTWDNVARRISLIYQDVLRENRGAATLKAVASV